MKSARHGSDTSKAEVTNITGRGFWLLVSGRELFVGFKHFPWFRQATVAQLLDVELPGPGHLYWPALDVDLALESIDNPKRFPLVSRVRPNNALQRTAGKGALKRLRVASGARRR